MPEKEMALFRSLKLSTSELPAVSHDEGSCPADLCHPELCFGSFLCEVLISKEPEALLL